MKRLKRILILLIIVQVGLRGQILKNYSTRDLNQVQNMEFSVHEPTGSAYSIKNDGTVWIIDRISDLISNPVSVTMNLNQVNYIRYV